MVGAVDDPEDVQADADLDKAYASNVEDLGEDAVFENKGEGGWGKTVNMLTKADVDEKGEEDDCRYTHCLGIKVLIRFCLRLKHGRGKVTMDASIV